MCFRLNLGGAARILTTTHWCCGAVVLSPVWYRMVRVGSHYMARDTWQGKCNRAIRESRRAPLGTKIASHMLMLTLPLLTRFPPRFTFTHLSSPNVPIKRPYSPFLTETNFVQVWVQVKQPAVMNTIST